MNSSSDLGGTIMELRYATMHDLKGVYNLLCDLEGKEMPIGEFEYIYCHNLSDKKIHYLVIEENNEIIAFGSLHIQKLLHHSSDVAEIQELVIRKGLRGKGIGSRLIARLKEISQNNKCELIEVCCNRKREQTHNFYELCGFSKTHYKFTLR
jgi:PhnO protein